MQELKIWTKNKTEIIRNEFVGLNNWTWEYFQNAESMFQSTKGRDLENG